MKFDSIHKTKARNAAKMIRAKLAAEQPGAGIELLRHWPDAGNRARGNRAHRDKMCIAAYIPIHSEIDVWPLMRALEDAGHSLALPCIKRKAHPLEFRCFALGDKLRRGAFGTREPMRNVPRVVPNIVLLPLLAYARDGYRLGYGGGFYDRTLQGLRQNKANAGKIFACGVAYSGQEVPTLPTDQYDEKLDGVLTETGFRKFI
ncbi:MAG: 5-formyltetrahydrofolate cyclo-ligase [Robiginitomaculum sp.]|nr:MAG: 5-formyltetrahydrofolate cyclo-ligase [Robiginitomaculum sp.]